MKTILFQGDSITDFYRLRDNAETKYDDCLGMGYPTMVKGRLGLENPNKYRFINRGISGNRIVDLYARIQADFIAVKPDYISILDGINDIWHGRDWNNGVDAEHYDKIYRMLIDDLLRYLPDIKIMIMEPFVLPGCNTVNIEKDPDRLNGFKKSVFQYSGIAKQVADDYNLEFVPLQQKLNEAAKIMGDEQILADGVHPTAIGHEIIAREWIKHFKEIE